MMKEFKSFLNDESNFVSICLKNVEFKLNKKYIKIEDLFDNNELCLTGMALSLYSDLLIPSSSNLEQLIDTYPALRLIYDNKKSHELITIYSLLQENTKINVSKFFKWQFANKFKAETNVELTNENKTLNTNFLLSFNNIEFSKQYCYKENLDYSYFVKQGRPFFAYHNFINYQMSKYGKIHKTLMEEARIRIHVIAIQNYDNNRIVSSCIIFSELINGNTLKIKLHIHMIKKTLFDYYKKCGLDEKSSSDKCKQLFIDFLKNEIDAKRLLSIFENALITLMFEKFDTKEMFTMDACSLWLPLMCFCKLYHLSYSTKYLNLCAESNQWLMYLIFSQLYQIPRPQVISNLENFSDIGLKQHLEYALHNVITSSNEPKTTSFHEIKSSFRKSSKQKIRKVSDKFSIRKNKQVNSSDSEETSDHENENKQTFNNDSNNLDSIDFYELLINCQNSSDPVKQLQIEALKWHTPVLSVFATFYPQHDKISCLCTFLFASLKQEFKNFNETKISLFNLNDLKIVIQSIAMKGFFRTLLNSLKIFLPNTILEIYADFLYHVFVAKDVLLAEKLHSTYKYELIKVTLSKHQSFIPLEWYEDVISKLTRITILKCCTISDLNNLTNILKQRNEYQRLIKLVYTLKSNKLSINIEDWLSLDDHSDQFTDICLKVIEELLKLQKFDEAEQLADFCELSKDRIHLARIARKIDLLRINNDFEEILEFWKTSHVQLMKIGIKDSDFIDFLKFQNTRSNLTIEKIVLLNLVCQLCPNDQETAKNLWLLLLQFVIDYKKKNELNNLREIFKKMLLFGKNNSNSIKELINLILKDNQIVDFNTSNTLNDQNIDALNILLNNLIDIGKLSQGYVIAKYFKYFNQDLRTILNMLYVCLNMIKPDDIDYSIQSYDTSSFKGIKLTNVLRSLSKQVSGGESTTEIYKDHIESLEKLLCLSNHGLKYCQQIKLDYRLSNELLQIDYKKILNENKFDLLKSILCSNNKNKFELAKDFVFIYEFHQEELCLVIIDEILPCMRAYVATNKDNNLNVNKQLSMIFNPGSNEDFAKLIKIFPNPNIFGIKLLEKTKTLLIDARISEDYILLTELLIRSHDCFIQSCSMDGISNVLQVCKQCAYKLEKAGEFNIMIRLLTGIGHFNEMTYIMDSLWNNHQFEMLFGKGIGKDDKLRLALLDYLKLYHPNDHETYTMVTLNFTMHREIAKMLEEAAYQQLKILETKEIENTPDIITDLQSILQYFSDAAQSFIKEDCVRQAESCIRKARLIALQINFLSSNRIIVNMNTNALIKFISTHSKFWEAYIISDAYDKKSDWSLWSLAIYNIFIINNNEKYLIDFKGHIPLTTNIIEEVANKFKTNNETSKLNNQSILNMKKLLKYCKDISIYYKIALQLDFKDVISELLSKNYSSIINDLIINKKNTFN